MESHKGNMMPLQKKIDINYKHEVSQVYELAQKHYLPVDFKEVKMEGPIYNAIFTFRVTVGEFSAEAEAPTKMLAKKLAAQRILPDLLRLPPPPEEERRYSRERKQKKHILWRELPKFNQQESTVQCLEMLVSKWHGKPPKYTVVEIDRESEPWIYHMQLTVADHTVVGTGESRVEAKKVAAAKMLNSFGYNYIYTEPQPRPREVPLDRAQENTAAVSPHPFNEEATENNARLEDTTEDTCSAPQENQSEEIQPSPVALDLSESVMEEVLQEPSEILTDTCPEPTGDNHETNQWSEPHAPRGSVETTPEAAPVHLPEVSEATTPQGQVEVTSEPHTAPVTLQEVSSQTISFISQEIMPEEIILENVLEDSPAGIEPSPETSQDPISETSANAEPQEEVQPAAVNLQVLPVEILSKLTFIGVIQENNGIVQWCESNPTTTHQEGPEVCSLHQAEEPQSSTPPAPCEPAHEPEVSREVSPGEDTHHQETHERISVLETQTETSSPPAPPCGHLVSYTITHACVKKIFKMAKCDYSYCRMAVGLHRQIEEHLKVTGDGVVSLKDLKKIGKKAAKSLKKEYGSADALLRAVGAQDKTPFEAAAVTHLNNALTAFHNRPTSALSRFFSRVRRAFTCQ